MLGAPARTPRPTPSRAFLVLVAALLVASAIPLALAEGEQDIPPKETGMGPGDVSDEPSHPADASDPGNGFSDGEDFSPTVDGERILDAHYLYEPFPFDVDLNNLVRVASEGAGLGEAEKHMYPGFGFFEAWWGWWLDKGQNARMSPYAGPGEPDGAIQDAHDDPDTWEDSHHHDDWDEFIWRGDNPWAGDPDHPLTPTFPEAESHPDDRMLLFLDPGTYKPHARQMIFPTSDNSAYILRNDADPEDVPDMEYTDNTNQGPEASPGHPHDGGWDLFNHYTTGTYDAGMLITVQAQTSVNPNGAGPTYDPRDALAYDVDMYTALSPQVETVYRTAVWDPERDHGDGEDEENVYPFHDEGVKQHAIDTFTPLWLESDEMVVDSANEATDPAAPPAGAVDDAAGKKAWRHEPNHPDDAYGEGDTWASHDPETSYGALSGDSTDYYEPGDDQTYTGYQEGDHAWLDTQAAWGVPMYYYNFPLFGTLNLRTIQSVEGLSGASDDQGGIPPGILGVSAHFGTWHDWNGDTWVGNIDEPGRWTSSEDPYNHGLGDPTDYPDDPFYQSRGDDPNDYADTDDNTRTDPAKEDEPEWRPVCGGGSVEATLTPQTPDGSWGQAGVYVIRDSDGRANPYDDIVVDALGEFTGDDEPRSRLVLEGPIDVDLKCRDDATGLWFGDTWIVSPTGNADYAVQVETEGEILADLEGRYATNRGQTVQGEVVTDVDVLGSLQGE